LAVPGSVANARPDSLSDAFFFSIETLATVGYGEMYLATLHGHVVASIQIVCGLDGADRQWTRC
jgi:inward rectifier potassium channel